MRSLVVLGERGGDVTCLGDARHCRGSHGSGQGIGIPHEFDVVLAQIFLPLL